MEKSFNPTNMNLALCTICLKEFYNLYDNEGCGIITNNKSGALLYNLLKWSGNDMTVEESIKNEVLKGCGEYILAFQTGHLQRDLDAWFNSDTDKSEELKKEFIKQHKEKWTKEMYAKEYKEYCKSKMAEIWLNIKADLDKRVLPDEIVIPKLDSYYHKFRLLREE